MAFSPKHYYFLFLILSFTSVTWANNELDIDGSYSIIEAPSWVDTETVVNSQAEKGSYGVTYYLLDRQLSYVNEHHDYLRIAYSIDDKTALADNSQIIVNYYPNYQKLQFHTVNIVRNGKTISALEDNSITVARSEDSTDRLMLTGKVTASIQIKGLQENDRIDYSYSVVGSNPVFDNKIFFEQGLGWTTPINKLHLKVISPKALNIHSQRYADKLEKHIEQGNHVYRMSLESLPAMKNMDYLPKNYTYFPFLQGTEFNSWREVVEWAEPYYDITEPLRAELMSLVNQWKSDPNKEDAILKAIQYVQEDIRYFGIEIGVNSHKPHSPNQVFERKYGDCKDKAVLLVHLLKALNVEAEPALVSSSFHGGISQYLPSPSAFDHVIVRLKYLDEYYYIDATETARRGELSSVSYQPFEKALPISSKQNDLVEVNNHPTHQFIKVNEHYVTTDFSMPTELKVTTTYKGGYADQIRYWYKTNSQNIIQEKYLNYYKKNYSEVAAKQELTIDDNEATNEIVIVEHYEINNFWTHASKFYYKDFTSGEIKERMLSPEVVDRDAPIAIPFPVNIEHHIKVQLPDNQLLEKEENNSEVVDDSFIFNVSSSQEKNQFNLQYHYQVLNKQVPSSLTNQYLKNLNDAYKAVSYRFAFAMNQTEQKNNRKNRLLKLIGK